MLRTAFTKPLLPVAFFLGGVTFDSVTLTRIDRLRDNLIMLLYLSLLGGLIVLTTRADLGRATTDETVVPGRPVQCLHDLLFAERLADHDSGLLCAAHCLAGGE